MRTIIAGVLALGIAGCVGDEDLVEPSRRDEPAAETETQLSLKPAVAKPVPVMVAHPLPAVTESSSSGASGKPSVSLTPIDPSGSTDIDIEQSADVREARTRAQAIRAERRADVAEERADTIDESAEDRHERVEESAGR